MALPSAQAAVPSQQVVDTRAYSPFGKSVTSSSKGFLSPDEVVAIQWRIAGELRSEVSPTFRASRACSIDWTKVHGALISELPRKCAINVD